jgi:hypothetical protein
MDERREAFLAGECTDDVLLFFNEAAVDDVETLAEVGEAVEDGVVLVRPGEAGRTAFERATGVDPMELAGSAMGVEGTIVPDCTDGECPDDDGTGDHWPRFVFAFAEDENPDVGDIYADGDVVHAYALCDCGTAYSQRWVAGERA